MFEKGVPVEIGGKTYNLVFTVAAMIDVTKRYGGISSMIEGMGITDVTETDADGNVTVVTEIDADGKETVKQNIDEKKMLPEIPWLVALLANQGIMMETSDTKPTNPKLITEAYVATFTMPYQFKDLMNAVMEAIGKGNGAEHQPKNAEPAI
jgi:hypothetical protein